MTQAISVKRVRSLSVKKWMDRLPEQRMDHIAVKKISFRVER